MGAEVVETVAAVRSPGQKGHLIESHHTVPPPQSRQLAVGEIPRMGAEGPAVGMGGQYRPLAQGQHLPEPGVAEVTHIHSHPQFPGMADQVPTRRRQPTGLLTAVAKGIAAIPRQPKQPDSQPVQNGQQNGGAAQGASTLQRQYQGNLSPPSGVFQFFCRGHQGE